jgi:acyl-CoA reductase-like NAD-dependent aldehyde dehydrogenase
LARRDHDEPSPIDKGLLIGKFSQATTQDVDDAVAAAKSFQLEWSGWAGRSVHPASPTSWRSGSDLGALMAYEVGKTGSRRSAIQRPWS